MNFSELCTRAGLTCPDGMQDILPSGICTDTERLEKGQLFVCLRGTRTDGHTYLSRAKQGGACAAVIEQGFSGELPEGLPTLCVPDTRDAVARLYDAWHGNPSNRLQLVGVTGTNGKTSVSWMLYELLRRCGIPCGLIGTVKCESPEGEIERDVSGNANMTTPDPERLYPMLARMADEGARYVIMEVTSHALAQKRCAPLHFDLGIFTNVTRDHLDFHGSMEAYFAAKKSLIDACDQVLLNVDDARLKGLAGHTACTAYTCSAGREAADFYAEDIGMSLDGVRYRLVSANAHARIGCPMSGQFAVINSLEAAAAALILGIDARKIKEFMPQILPVPGRMERVPLGKAAGFTVLIDYAHTPDALENLLRAVHRLRLRSQRIVLVFGCGGDRDKGKRAAMGQIASRMADFVIITADNSRTEPTDEIIADILRGVDRRAHYRVIRDRKRAIRHAIEHAGQNDVILLAGKGHENYEINQNGRQPFDERAIVQEAVRQLRMPDNCEQGE